VAAVLYDARRRAAGGAGHPPDGTRVTAHDPRPTTDDAVVGKVRFWRHAFTAPGQHGLCPLDTERSWPARGYAAQLQEWAVYGPTAESYRESQTVLERILGVSLRAQAIETSVADAAGEVRAFDEQPAEPPAPASEQTILVVQADGTGVPMGPASPAAPSVRLSQGQKRGQKKEAVVTGLYPIAPVAARTSPGAHGLAAAPPSPSSARLLQAPGRPEAETRPPPVGQELRATLEGQAVAMTRLVQRVTPREGSQSQHRVALTEGAEALPQQGVTYWPEPTLNRTTRLWHMRFPEIPARPAL
jgi:hypothetical protein